MAEMYYDYHIERRPIVPKGSDPEYERNYLLQQVQSGQELIAVVLDAANGDMIYYYGRR